MIKITKEAAKRIKEIFVNENMPDSTYLRIRVKGGGCSGFMYDLSWEEEPKPEDMKFEDGGINVVVDKKSYLYLKGTEIDFSDELMSGGLKINNPNATNTCGCGESFS